MKKIDTVIFDLDGTLLDTLKDLQNAINYIQDRYGYPLHTMEQVRSHVGNGIPNLVAKSIPEEKENPLFSTILEEYKAYYGAHCNDATRPYPGIMEMLDTLQAEGYRMAIVSNKSDPAVKELNRLYFKDYIEIAIGGNEEAGIRRKPAPDTVFTALEGLGANSDQAVYIGDSEVDILTAQNSGMPCILCEWGFREKSYLISQGGSYFIDQAGQLSAMIKKVENDLADENAPA